jgi:hypothetical protein
MHPYAPKIKSYIPNINMFYSNKQGGFFNKLSKSTFNDLRDSILLFFSFISILNGADS